MLAHDELVVRDFNPHSVRHAAAQLSSSSSSSSSRAPAPGRRPVLRHENGNRTRVVTAPSLLTAGLCFRGDVISHLPYVETRAICAPRWESVLMDGERLFGLYFKVYISLSPGTGLISHFFFFSLQEDDADAHKVGIDMYHMAPQA
jgi:hypothetical protein